MSLFHTHIWSSHYAPGRVVGEHCTNWPCKARRRCLPGLPWEVDRSPRDHDDVMRKAKTLHPDAMIELP